MRKTDAAGHSAELSAKRRTLPNLEISRNLVGTRDLRSLRTVGSVRHFAENRQIYGEGEDADFFFKVVSGVVRFASFSATAADRSIPFTPPATYSG